MEIIFIYYFAVFYLGAILGSFLNVVSLDIQKLFSENDLEHRNELFFFTRHIFQKYFWRSLLSRRSHCDSCGHVLSTFELVPVISYIAQRGRCTSCQTSITSSHLWVEILCGAYFLGIFYTVFWQFDVFSIDFVSAIIFQTILFGSLFVLALFDYRTQIIPDILILISGALSLWWVVSNNLENIWWHIAGGLLLSGLFYALWWFSRGEWIGFADGKLAGVIGLLLGISAGLTALTFAVWAGTIISLLLIAYSKYAKTNSGIGLQTAVPFGPFLVIGVWAVFISDVNLFYFPWDVLYALWI